ncbi:MAG: spore coat U domain-containing protein [Pseudomonadota bacterium]
MLTIPPGYRYRQAFALLAILSMFVWAIGAHAAGCTISSTGLAFGPYQPISFAGQLTSTDITSNASVALVCTGIVSGGSYNISLGPSIVGTGDRISTRYLANNSNGGDHMAFNIYTSGTYASVWGNGSVGSLIGGTINPGDSNQSTPVYGKIPAGQSTLKAGSFTGSMTMTVTYNP